MNAIEAAGSDARERLATYVDMLGRWNSRIRLAGPRFIETCLTGGPDDPVEQSLSLYRLLPARPASALDIGSGNGLPALPLSVAYGIPYVLVESDRRKAAFLREAARVLGCPASVAACRIEELPPEPYDLITARAFAPLSRLLEIAFPRQGAGTVCLFPKGANVSAELDEARRAWAFDAQRHVSGSGTVVAVRSIMRR